MIEQRSTGREGSGVELSAETFMTLLDQGVPHDGSEIFDVNERVVFSSQHVAQGTEEIWNTLQTQRYNVTISSTNGVGIEDNRFLWLGRDACVTAETIQVQSGSDAPTFLLRSHPLSSRYTVLIDLMGLVAIADTNFVSVDAVKIPAKTWESLVVGPDAGRQQQIAQQLAQRQASELVAQVSPDMADDIRRGFYQQVVVVSESPTEQGPTPIATAWMSTPHGYLSFFLQPGRFFGKAHYLEPVDAWMLFMMASYQLPRQRMISTW
ncbi:hypothetical protein QDX23_06050 [Auritidibacter ignavus]|uniref:hypothetical protein n=1 Tax=Auritidibacter ignavus TaxID=678932 RepID=UPI00244A30F0|nr:hypothetical protein [Auritidibacter ignavus]WGH89737.1 hypothetical protein QDX23_06090 [Auritidibacter ignavus]WGH91908.1 hypothetical protein QDX23_06050 [Auritidibacter ignavus]